MESLKSAALSCNNPNISQPEKAELWSRTIGFEIKRSIESKYLAQDQRRSALRSANRTVRNDAVQVQALLNSTMTATEFVNRLDSVNQPPVSDFNDQGPLKVGSSLATSSREMPPPPPDPVSATSQQGMRESPKLPASQELTKRLAFESMTIDELHQYLLRHGKPIGTSRSSCIAQCIAIASCNDSTSSLPLEDVSNIQHASQSSSMAVNDKPSMLERLLRYLP